jgi:hypothetical protein
MREVASWLVFPALMFLVRVTLRCRRSSKRRPRSDAHASLDDGRRRAKPGSPIRGERSSSPRPPERAHGQPRRAHSPSGGGRGRQGVSSHPCTRTLERLEHPPFTGFEQARRPLEDELSDVVRRSVRLRRSEVVVDLVDDEDAWSLQTLLRLVEAAPRSRRDAAIRSRRTPATVDSALGRAVQVAMMT